MTCSSLQQTICIIVINNSHMVNKLIDGVSYLKAKFQTDELDQKLNEAVSEENWQASTQLLHEIANASYNYQKEQRILTFLWDKLKHKSWKKVLKTLHLVDFLLKYGPSSLITALRENIYEFRNFDNYTLVADGIDRGESIRKQSRVVVGLLSDDQLLSDERAKAKQIKDRMANVIGSAAYYGSYSNDAPTTSKKETYESFTASNFNKSPAPYGGSNGQQGMSFGESVMKSLQQAKKVEERMEPPPQVEKPANTNKLNLSKMNERKPEDKKNFNNLAMKLVKPPEKKPADKKVEQPTPLITPVSSKPQPKQQGKVDIMDIDFLSFDNTQPPKAEKSTSDGFDFLGGPVSAPPLKTAQSSPPLQKQTDFNSLNFGLLHSDPQTKPQQHQIPITSQQAPNFQYNNTNNNFIGFNYQPPTTQPNNFSFNQAPLPTQTISISLSTPEPKQSTSNTNNSLIDFSNFRQQLTQLGHPQQKKNTLQWNW